MIPVTAWTRKVKQPRGGYLPVKSMQAERFDDGCVLNPNENLNPGTIGTAVDYLSRVLAGGDVYETFQLPLLGAGKIGMDYRAKSYLGEIMMFLEDWEDNPVELITAGVNLSRYDIVFKASNPQYINALNGAVTLDSATLENIEILLRRILAFRNRNQLMQAKSQYLHYKSFAGLTGADCLSGEIDILSDNAIWDCKAMTAKLRATYTAQLLAYYMMLFYSCGRVIADDLAAGWCNPNVTGVADFTLGFFNPRENVEYKVLASSLNPMIFVNLDSDMVNPVYMY